MQNFITVAVILAMIAMSVSLIDLLNGNRWTPTAGAGRRGHRSHRFPPAGGSR
ncbi:hypothetical protein OG552_17175 [Streptomyces sp. NBC_01476]|uniref:hypothetical protein n=1 Tax=Streptomyces sp. NBC_01476 TaxID=2903881 RepID=UPI002E3603CB|nr:hypothetical protein [Streptomyces sp. NBC_01476]